MQQRLWQSIKIPPLRFLALNLPTFSEGQEERDEGWGHEFKKNKYTYDYMKLEIG